MTAFSALNPNRQVRCPLNPVAGSLLRMLPSVFAHIRIAGPLNQAPEPKTGNKIYFTRYPALSAVGPDGFPADGCIQYVMGTLSQNKISVVTQHKVPQVFNNNLVNRQSIMKNYQTRWISNAIAYWPEYGGISDNSDDALLTPDGQWVTVYLPSEPRLSAGQIQAVRAKAKALHYNVIQIPRNPENRPVASLLPYPVDIIRNKAVSSTFKGSVNSVPCWATPQNYRDYPNQTSPAFFAKYASSPRNMGQYYVDGETMTFAQFIQ